MPTDPLVLLDLDLAETFAFALNGALTAVRAAHVDIVGVITLGMITALGGALFVTSCSVPCRRTRSSTDVTW